MTESGAGRGRKHRVWLTVVVAVIVAVLLLAGSFWGDALLWRERVPDWWPWLENLLVNLGAAVLLVVPLEWIAARLRREADAAEARTADAVDRMRDDSQASIRDLKQQFDGLDARVTSLADLSAVVAEAATGQARADADLFTELGHAVPTSDSVRTALHRAAERKLTSDRPVRVPVSDDADLRISFGIPDTAGGVEIRLEAIDGEILEEWRWEEKPAAMTFQQVADVLDGQGEREPIDVVFVFTRLSETLTTAVRHASARPIIELFPPQWALTNFAIVSLEPLYTVTHDRKDRVQMDVQVKQKRWLDYDSYDMAHWVAAELFPLTPSQRDGSFRDGAPLS
ncbi:hypothetical protein [Myceligenerans salitolerans]|uniref:Uncharacterized protein n=1 Tax=Myceligenerans salitolerans TaxID=1230528 RepID=A0ABS3IA07_9MICO|nr:hypothetical protein [Myceligenerans salitolerans]MBO0609865.1 hypothetical protein [Myceligenerans salitolerans]